MLNRKDLRNRCDKLCQTCCRYKGAFQDNDGVWFNRCVTCGAYRMMNQLDGGHFIPRGCYPTRWNIDNVWPQCTFCNRYKNGAYIEYSKWVIDNLGKDKWNELLDKYNGHKCGDIKPFTIVELREIYNGWLDKGRELEEKINLKLFPKGWKHE